MLPLLLLLLAAFLHGTAAAQGQQGLPSLPIGVNYGANADNLPTPAAVASFLAKSTTIDRVKLFDANPAFLDAFAANAPSISLAVSIPNAVLPTFADKSSGLDAARGWVRDNLSPHISAGANVTLLLAGNEVLGPTVVPDLVVALLPAMRRLAQALQLESLPDVRVTTPHYLGILAPSDGIPSNARFRPGLDAKVLAPMLRFHNDTGWPTKAEAAQVGVGVEEAKDFNAGMIRVCSGGKGTPLMPGRKFETYVFSLFDENQKPGPVAERNFGIFNTDFTPKYDLGLLRQGSSGSPNPSPKPSPNPSPSGGGKWCVAKSGASATDLQNNIFLQAPATVMPGG